MNKIIFAILTAATLIFCSNAQAATNLLTDDFSTSGPKTDWTLEYSTPTNVGGVTFTAQSNAGYLCLTSTTQSGAKVGWWQYTNGSAWTNYTESFAVVDMKPNTLTTSYWGVRGIGHSGATIFSYYFRYAYFGGEWKITPTNMTPTDNYSVVINPGDVITTAVSGWPATITVAINGTQVLTESGNTTGNMSTATAGSIVFGIQRTVYGYSQVIIDNLVVDELAVADTPTFTVTPTYTPTPTATPSKTNTPYVTPTQTPLPWYPYMVNSISVSDTTQPQAVCYYADKVWVSLNGNPPNSKVLEINPDTLAIEHTITVGGSNGGGLPQGLHGFNGYVFSSNISDGTLTQINTSTYATNTFGQWISPNKMIDDSSNVWLAATELGTNKDIAVEINPSTCAIVDTFYLGGVNGGAYGISYGDGKIMVGMFTSQKVVVIDAVTGAVQVTIPLTNSPADITYLDGYFYVTSWGDGVVWKINSTTYAVTPIALNFFVPDYSWVIYGVANGGGYVWATDYEPARLHKIYVPLNLDCGYADIYRNAQGIAYGNGYVYTTDALNKLLIKTYPGDDFVPTPTCTLTATPSQTPTATPTYTVTTTSTPTATPTATPTSQIIKKQYHVFIMDNQRRTLK